MHRIPNKLRARRGETLTETLCALLIVALGSILLATMITAATRMNSSAMAQDAAFYTDLSAAARQDAAVEEDTLTLREANSTHSFQFAVPVYGKDGLRAYAPGPEQEVKRP